MSIKTKKAGKAAASGPADAGVLSRSAVVGPLAVLLALPAAVIPQDAGGIGSMFLVSGLLLVSAMLFAAECAKVRVPLVSHAAQIVVSRVKNARHNWEQDTLRSFSEMLAWLWVTMHTHVTYGNVLISAPLGVLSGFGVVLCGEFFTNVVRVVENRLFSLPCFKGWKNGSLRLLEVGFLGGMFAVGMSLHRASVRSPLLQAFVTSVLLVCLAQVLRCWSATRVIGSIVHNRLVEAQSNWAHHTIRSALETSAWVAATGAVHHYLNSTESLAAMVAAATLGAFIGLTVSVLGQLFSNYLDSEMDLTGQKPAGVESADTIWREERGVSVRVPRIFWRESKRKASRPVTMEEVARHCKRDDAWICVEGHAYDVTAYVEHHPGGWLPIANLAGKDVTDAFANYHPAHVYEKLLPSYYVGPIVDYEVSDFVKEHRELRQQLLREGAFETRPSYYFVFGSWYVGLFTSALYMTIMRSTFTEHMIGACLMAIFWQQVAFFGHDIGHNAVSHLRKADLWWGLVLGNTTGGISLGWWKRSHNVHHVVCNSIENDPDIQHMPIFAVDEGIFGRFWSTYHQKFVITDFAARLLVSVQHYLYYPVMAVARFNLYVQSWLLLLSKEKVQHRKLEIVTLATFATWFSLMVAYCLGSWQERVCYLLVSHGLAGLLHVQITLSHFAEDTYHGQAYNDDSDEWFRMQVKTTLNVDCPTWMDWFHGGLQFQVEHHLYPRLPRHNLRRARELVKALCAKHGIEYKELGFFAGNMRVFNQLKKTALEARKLTKGDAGFYHSALYEGMNAIG